MQQPVQFGVLGAAKFAREHMAPAIHAASGARLAALATSDAAKANPFLSFCPDLSVLNSYEALLSDPGIDAVYIPLPNHMHVEWSLRAMDAGKHVLCEKPMTMKAAEFDQLIAKRDQTGVLAAEAYMIVHHPQWQLARDLIADGAIGNLVHVTGAFSFDNRADTGNIRNRAETGGGGLRDIGVYVIGGARFATGAEPVAVQSAIRWQNDIDTFTEIRAQFPGFTYSAYVSIRMHPHQEMVFHGEGGLIRLTTPFNARVFGEARVELHRPGLEVQVNRFPAANHYKLQVEAFCRSIRDGADYPCPLEFSRGTQEVIDRVFEDAVSL
ncbi:MULTISPECIES: Gfo/Idh/MocA family protein [unclassified Ruegeria]|uniref:Gfo/Idh/MocA family protein n=1 Tax=unclassified Ruegeria TaxID=2625375 RepID=UPI00148867D2|nr:MULTISPECIES: Gfo/Idh/MocA family oxidoreductase [unclassified Ruegeria]NOD75099.1 Gfo/Idh/MocA family oxidoreductase [Ruegeria sp. HKCCD4332]NOD87060.1 Gfo/Idh/MocA family oxidoreductase [Ruegeria sp. HKCCD4318]NOE12615.1 Gfo/Idh/MocA family oxidoreductase [Ruegeria sp. HKCCD4318-2]NOG09220.1 Gfo/Idh/MocA family oxidoreductase [Ruegeria sp. HKCCD4315]